MNQFALPLSLGGAERRRIVIGAANRPAIDALAAPDTWPFGTAILTGPPRSGKSMLGAWFAGNAGLSGNGGPTENGFDAAQSRRLDAPARIIIDNAHLIEETTLFHRWNRAREQDAHLLLIAGAEPWRIALPDLASRLGAALHLEIGAPDDALAAELVLAHAHARGLMLGEEAANYLAARSERSFAGIEALVAMIDTLSLERKAPPTLAIWRAAIEALYGPDEPRMI